MNIISSSNNNKNSCYHYYYYYYYHYHHHHHYHYHYYYYHYYYHRVFNITILTTTPSSSFLFHPHPPLLYSLRSSWIFVVCSRRRTSPVTSRSHRSSLDSMTPTGTDWWIAMRSVGVVVEIVTAVGSSSYSS